MTKKILVLIAIILLFQVKIILSQNSNWHFGLKINYGFTNFKLNDLNKYINSVFQQFKSKDIPHKLDKISSGNFWDAELIIKPHKLMAFSIGIMPEFKAEKNYNISLNENDETNLYIKAGGIPRYFSAYLYIPSSYFYIEPFINLKLGNIQKAELIVKNVDKKTGIVEDYTLTGKTNYISISTGFDYRWKRFLIITTSVGYQFSKVNSLKDRSGNTVHIENTGKFTLDFSGTFLETGIKLIL
ncbi:hypothetical protein DRQ09_05830 [candidate division KSB1 bacterium]|nr:MAG: hypothetical protein DRQ09_05830 [candidate division KSB1 bacterium]